MNAIHDCLFGARFAAMKAHYLTRLQCELQGTRDLTPTMPARLASQRREMWMPPASTI